MKLLIVLSRFPLPARKGDKLRAWEQIKGLSEYFEIHLACLGDEHPSRKEIEEVTQFVHSLKIITIPIWKRIPAFIPALFSGLPFQVAYFQSARLKEYIRIKLKEEQIEYCYVQLIRLGRNIPQINGVHYFLDYMDALSAGMSNRIPESNGLKKFLFKLESKRLRQYENKIYLKYQAYSAITIADAKFLPVSIQKEIHIIPNGVSELFFDTPTARVKNIDLLFTGNMGYFPNVKAACFLVEEVLPILNTQLPGLKVCLAGTDPNEKVKGLKQEQVEVTGFVPDMRDIMARANLFVAPLFTGSGLQNKLLESMAAGMPVITTSLANEALGAMPGKEIFVCNTAQEFASLIIELIQNPSMAQQVGVTGQHFIRNNYGWKASNEKLALAIQQMKGSLR